MPLPPVTLLTDVTAIDLRVGRHAESYTWSELSVVLARGVNPLYRRVCYTLAWSEAIAFAVLFLVAGPDISRRQGKETTANERLAHVTHGGNTEATSGTYGAPPSTDGEAEAGIPINPGTD